MVIAERLTAAMPAVARSTIARSARLDYLDSLKVLLTALVIAHHAGQAYGPTGGRWPIFDPERAAILGPFFAVNAAFFMGLFFLISAYFVPASFDRKGPVRFLKERFVRFGVPVVIIGLTIGALSRSGFDMAHLWFAAHLLVYAVLYTGWRVLNLPAVRIGPPTHRTILGYALLLAGATSIVRVWLPVDRWVAVVGVLPVEVAHLPQYASLFAIGLLAARGRWLESLPTSTGLTWLAVGVGASALRYVYPLVGNGLPGLAGGGFVPGSFLWSTWEAFICVGLCVGLPVLCREYGAGPSRLLRAAVPNAFGAYVVHVMPVVVGLQFGLAAFSVDPLLKFGIVTIVGVPLSFLLAAGLRRLPGARAIL
jgi:glucan biosynthesis protein C